MAQVQINVTHPLAVTLPLPLTLCVNGPLQLLYFLHFSFSVIIIVMYDNDIAQFLLSAYDLGMVNGEYVFIALDAASGNKNRPFSFFRNLQSHARIPIIPPQLYFILFY